MIIDRWLTLLKKIIGIPIILDATSAVTFDSYLCKTLYPKGEIDENYRTNQKQEEQRLIEYPDGITMEHVRASMSPHTVIDYPKFEDIQNHETRYLWDGAFLSNTPLRELLHLHRYYWNEVKEVEHVPHLEVYIIDLYPTVERNQIDPPKDADTIQDREIKIRFHDRTRYDVKVAKMISDYLILHGELKNLAIKCINALADDDIKKDLQYKFETEYNKLLDEMKPHSKGRREEAEFGRSLALKTKRSMESSRTYRDLLTYFFIPSCPTLLPFFLMNDGALIYWEKDQQDIIVLHAYTAILKI